MPSQAGYGTGKPATARPGEDPRHRGGAMTAWRLSLRLLAAAGLAVDAVVHWGLAAQFDPVVGRGSLGVSEGALFRLEAAVALAAAVLVLLVRHWVAALVALLVAAAGVGAVLLYNFVDVGAFGPVPDMFDPTWYPEKTLSLIGEAVAAVAAAALLLLARRDRRPG